MSTAPTLVNGSPRPRSTARADRRSPGAGTVLRWELVKLAAQWRVRLTLLVCVLAPFAFLLALNAQEQLPVDTLFGRWVKDSGFAPPLLVLGFAAQWVFPVLTSLVAGDAFSSEDHLGTWKTILTRSASRRSIFIGKALAAALYTILVVTVLALSSLAAGLIIVGSSPLVDLSGSLVEPSRAGPLVLASWATALPPTLAFTALALLISAWTRNSIIAVAGPVLVGLAMQLYAFLGGADLLGRLLLTNHFYSWHGMLSSETYLRPLAEGLVVSAAYGLVFLGLTWLVLRHRDETGG